MAKGNLAKVMTHVFAHEGGYVDHPDDPGGATKYGITLATLRAWRRTAARNPDVPGLLVKDGEVGNTRLRAGQRTEEPLLGRPSSVPGSSPGTRRLVTKADVKALSVADATAIYEANYARVIRFDDLPPGLDYAVLDFAINSGPKRAAQFLQRILGVEVDGIIGPRTCATAQTANPADTINRLTDARLKFLRGLGTYKTFGKGWERRVAEVRKVALEMAGAIPPPPQPGCSRVAREGCGSREHPTSGGEEPEEWDRCRPLSGLGLSPPGPPPQGGREGPTRQPDDPGVEPEPDPRIKSGDDDKPPSNAAVMIVGATVGLLLLAGFGAPALIQKFWE